MGKEIVLVKVSNGFQYATDSERDKCVNWKLGQAIKVSAVQQKKRSLKFHQRYWAGLLAITLEYWEPATDMTTEAERKLISKFCKALDDVAGGSNISKWGDEFLTTLALKRAVKIQAPNKTASDLHDWIKVQAGYYEVVITPSGPTKKLKSINFNSMCDDEFKDFYKKAFNVCWKYVLSINFKSEVDAHNAVEQLLSVG